MKETNRIFSWKVAFGLFHTIMIPEFFIPALKRKEFIAKNGTATLLIYDDILSKHNSFYIVDEISSIYLGQVQQVINLQLPEKLEGVTVGRTVCDNKLTIEHEPTEHFWKISLSDVKEYT